MFIIIFLGIADSKILQLGYISHEDERSCMIPFEPKDLQFDLIEKLRFESSKKKTVYRTSDGTGTYATFSIFYFCSILDFYNEFGTWNLSIFSLN